MNVEQARFNMIEQQVRPWDVSDPAILELLATVKREDFVPAAYKALAFADMELPLPTGGHMLPPRVQARLLQDTGVQAHETALQIGVGSGYLTALLAKRARRVVALEIEPDLARMARENLRVAGIHNAEVRQADAAQPATAEGQYDVILLCGSVAEPPANLLEKLTIGGRLVAVVGEEPAMRATVFKRVGDNQYEANPRWETVLERLHGFAPASQFRF